MKFIKYFLLSLIALILFLGLSIFVFLLTFDLNHYRSFVVQRASNTLNRPVKIGSLSTKLSLVPTIVVKDLRVLDDSQEKPLLEIPELEATIELLPLWNKQISIQNITIPSASFFWKWTSKTKEQEASTASAEQEKALSKNTHLSKLWIEQFSINTLNCHMENKDKYDFKIDHFTVKQLSKFSFNFIYDKKSIKVSGNFGSLLELLAKKQKLPIDLNFDYNKTTLKIKGQIEDMQRLNNMRFKVDASTPNLSNLLVAWNIQHKKIPTLAGKVAAVLDGNADKMTLSKFSVELGKNELLLSGKGSITDLTKNPQLKMDTTLTLNKGSLAQMWQISPLEMRTKIALSKTNANLTAFKLNAGRSDIEGEINIDWKKKPVFIHSKLASAYFDLNAFIDLQKANTPPSTSKNTPVPKNKFLLSTQKLPFDLLKKVNTDVALQVTHLRLPNQWLDYMTLNTKINTQNGLLNAVTQANLLGGVLQGQTTINANTNQLALKMKTNALQLDQIKSLEKEIQGITANAEIALDGKGDSLHTLASTASGSIILELTDGKILNKWFNSLPTALNLVNNKGNTLSLNPSTPKADFLCGAVNLNVKNGIAVSDEKIAFETDTLDFLINGTIDFGKESLNLNMLPSVPSLQDNSNQLLSVGRSITIKGPWTNISWGIDTQKMLGDLVNIVTSKSTANKATSQTIETTSLCKKALGRNLTQSKKVQKRVVQKSTKQSTPTTQQKPDLKQQILKSLSQALTDQVTKKQ